ncbi:fibronectin type III domain-containing protein [Teredinibacter sp. KSP-S5-2]|uniref:fibronectin type III domain-containing protein n=1 Tax=Teredinibacter sp. KSP-S5-2 TaxID=3034506 RepID=UPI0029348999|nr:fibronectin type III domain-containing protein [Teredinibacter sp. KSP-S5-2]WNO09056.1 fibronectin type III domain-containing protein [Teredinibacter sp. KSP-S5-2]
MLSRELKALRRVMTCSPIAAVLTSCGGDGSGLIAAKPEADYEVNVSWEAPTTRENGDNLPYNEIQSYELQYWQKDSDTATSITIHDRTILDFDVAGLYPSAYYFRVAAIDNNNQKSEYSQTWYIDLSQH